VESLPSKRRILKKKEREEQRLKRKRGETSVKKLHVLRKREREDEIYKLLGDILSKERKKIIIFYSGKSDVWPHPYPHIICNCTTFYSLTFLFLTLIHYTILHEQ
jgi:superfamily I DNA and/or RNA helicase